jgi:hypothetical protein
VKSRPGKRKRARQDVQLAPSNEKALRKMLGVK